MLLVQRGVDPRKLLEEVERFNPAKVITHYEFTIALDSAAHAVENLPKLETIHAVPAGLTSATVRGPLIAEGYSYPYLQATLELFPANWGKDRSNCYDSEAAGIDR